jgi:ubiquinone/menaquinone biosynthesis C-methylase UbiE
MYAREGVFEGVGTAGPQEICLPAYLTQTYTWAYLNPTLLPWLDRPAVVSTILWGQANRLMRFAISQFAPGQRLLQAACVYGTLLPQLAQRIGSEGELEVVDVSDLQVGNARRKLAAYPQASVRRADLASASSVTSDSYDAVDCFFLLHEVPEDARRRIVDNLLRAVRPGGKIVFVDYHRPADWHPLRPVMSFVFRDLEPYAPSLFDASIPSRSARAGQFDWTAATSFGGLYQQVVGVRRT